VSDIDVAATLYPSPPAPAAATPPAAPAPAPSFARTPLVDPAARLYGEPTVATAPAAPAPNPAARPAPAPATSAPAPASSGKPAAVDKPATEAPADGERAEASTPADPLTPERAKEIAKTFVDLAPEDVKADRARRGRDFYDAVPDGIAREVAAGEWADMPADAAKALQSELAEMTLDAGATAEDLAVVREALAEARATPMTDEARIASRDRCIDAFNDAFGKDAAKVLATTRTWVAADPRRAALIAKVGDNPTVALRMARLAMAAQR
jgi:hypothetical protein